MSLHPHYLKILYSLVTLILCQNSVFAVDRSIQHFVSQREQWPKLTGVPQTLEGRISTFSSKSLRFRNCPIPFHFAGDIPKLTSDFKNVEITGELVKENGRLIFKVRSLKKKPDDMEYFITQESKIDRTKPREWFALADWAKQRAGFYNDKKLAEKAVSAYESGIQTEYRHLKSRQPDSLLRLAERAQKYQLDPILYDAFRHEALVLDWQKIQKQKQAKQESLLPVLLKYFPTAKTPQPKDMPEERKQYLKSQVEVFQQADKLKRLRLVRWFYSQIILDEILEKLGDGGSNGFKIAAQIAKQLPERKDLVTEYQNQKLQFDFDRIDELPRQYVLDLSQEFQRRNNKKKAKQTLINWIGNRQKKLESSDADGRVQLARDMIELTQENEAAAKILLEAWSLNPKSTEATTLLRRLGFMLQKDKWLNPKEVIEFRSDPIRMAIRNGTVTKGMNRAQVYKVLGAPTQIGRSFSGGEINELWIYSETGAQALVIQLARKNRTTKFKVVRMNNAPLSGQTLQD